MALSRGRRLVQAGLVAVVVWCAAAGSPVGAQGWHQDERYGFKLQPPRDWKPIPLKASENWLVAKFLSDRKDRWTDGRQGWTWEHQSELMVIAFVHDAIENARRRREEALEKAKAKAKEEQEKAKGKSGGGADDGGEGADDDGELVVSLVDPYKDYEDYLDRTYSGGGFYISEREEGESNGVPVTKLEIKVEKLTYTGPKRIQTWIFHAEGVDFALQFEVLEDAFGKHKSEFQSTLRSFREIPRTMGPLPTDTLTADGLYISLSAMKKGTPEERKLKRQESELQLHERAQQSLPPSWQVKEHERFLLVFNTDTGFVDKIAESADGLYGWAEENLGFIGPDEYVRRPILRLCATREEMNSLRRGVRSSGSWAFDTGHEVVGCKDQYGSGWQIDSLNRELFDLWLRERDEQIWLGMPQWVRHGLYEYVEGARASGRKLEFKNYQTEFRNFREVVQKKQNIPVRALVQMTTAEFYDRENSFNGLWNRLSQADIVVRFLLSPEARRSRQTKTLLFDYIRHLRDVVVELEGQDLAAQGEKEPTTEEEEEELYRQRHEAWQSSEREREVVQRTFQRAFEGWSQKDWESFERAFVKYAN